MGTDGLIQTIQHVLTPAVMVSSSALLLLGFQTKFSNLANRFRALNHEKRLLAEKPHRTSAEESRFVNLEGQVGQLMRRATLVKRAIVLTYGAIMCFAGSSVLIFASAYMPAAPSHPIAFVVVAGFFLLLTAAVFLIQETLLFYHIIKLESSS